ncbi:hypothetical protein QTG54_016156 [Skeletonema marinoi]|uniref:Uncharacterized protein n=1 Tax=Skeletonema marinoi TaxID=267567 RepID=A0AAD8XSS6_9STRA|nr:hypothetical protein QTG54_016156 [Skeletonema marinoi]
MTSSDSNVHASAAKHYCITVATKTHDGGSTGKPLNDSEPSAKRPRRRPVRKNEDPFMYYSHQETRMNALLLSSGENDAQVARESQVRKTRISFELHPSLLLEDLLPVNGPELLLVVDDTRGDTMMIEDLQRFLYGVDDDNEIMNMQ